MNAAIEPQLTIEAFESASIDADRFGHEAHVYVAWLYVRRYDLPDAIARFDGALRRLVTRLGAESKYHATLTWFFLLLVAERAEADEPWLAFKQRNHDLVQDSKTILSRYYTENTVFSERARSRFLLPDKLASANRP